MGTWHGDQILLYFEKSMILMMKISFLVHFHYIRIFFLFFCRKQEKTHINTEPVVL